MAKGSGHTLLGGIAGYIAATLVANVIDGQLNKSAVVKEVWMIPTGEVIGGVLLHVKSKSPFWKSVGTGVAISGGLRLAGVDFVKYYQEYKNNKTFPWTPKPQLPAPDQYTSPNYQNPLATDNDSDVTQTATV